MHRTLRRDCCASGSCETAAGSTRSRARRRCRPNTPIPASSAGCASISGRWMSCSRARSKSCRSSCRIWDRYRRWTARSCTPWPRARAAIRCRRMRLRKTPTGAATGMPIVKGSGAVLVRLPVALGGGRQLQLPLAFEVTASRGEQPQAQRLLLQERHELLDGASLERRQGLRRPYQADQPAVGSASDQADHRHSQLLAGRGGGRRGVVTKLVSGQQNVIYTYDGAVSCMCPQTGEVRSMDYGGFEREQHEVPLSGALLGSHLQGHGAVPGGRLRIRLEEDRRVFTPVARSSYVWRTTTTSAARWSGSTAGWRAGSGSSVRASAGWRRCSCASPWR